MDFPSNDQIIATAAQYLIDGEEYDAANVLLSCSLDYNESGGELFSIDDTDIIQPVVITLMGPRAVFDILSNEDHSITKAIRKAIEAVWPGGYYYLQGFHTRVVIGNIDANWRTELLDIARGKTVHNQGTIAQANNRAKVWSNLIFSSQSEIRIAKALDQEGVLYLPNCKARLGSSQHREN